jgi:hypothetical protein
MAWTARHSFGGIAVDLTKSPTMARMPRMNLSAEKFCARRNSASRVSYSRAGVRSIASILHTASSTDAYTMAGWCPTISAGPP